jgi:pimeloyl-ACP methyl ester carboxylesterase
VPFAEVGDVRLFYTDEGSGDPALLFVHGYACDSHDWSWQLPHFTATHRVVAVDLRGHGRSSAPPSGYGAVELAGDVAALAEQLDLPPVVAFGHSMGGIVVSALAVEHPALVRGLVCVDPAYLLPDDIGALSDGTLSALNEADPVPLIEGIFQAMDSPARSPALRTWQLRRMAGMEPHVLRQAFENQVKGLTLLSNSRPYLTRRACPVLSFYADPSRIGAETAVFADSRSRSVGWEGSGHWLHQERPGEFNSIVSGWLSGL